MQDLVLKSDGLPEGLVTRWEWFGVGETATPGLYYDFRVTLCHTSLAALGKTYAENYDGKTPARVFHRDPLFFEPVVGGWFGFTFDTPFAYNGRDNLIVEVWWVDLANGAACATDWGRESLGRSVLSMLTYGEPEYGYPHAGLVHDYIHYFRVTVSGVGVAPTSLGRVRALFR
jgi:hypothetical protein